MIELKKLSVNGFRCFSTKTEVEFGKITLLTGANSSGKSSFMYSLLGLLQTDGVPYSYSTNGAYVELGDYLAISHNHKANKEIDLDLELTDGGVPYHMRIQMGKPEDSNMPRIIGFECKNSFFSVKARGDIKGGVFTADLDYFPSRNPDEYAQNAALRNERIELFRNNPTNIEKGRVDFIISYLSAIGKEMHVKNGQFDGKGQLLDGSHEQFIVFFDVVDHMGNILENFNKSFNFVSSYRMPAERSYVEKQVGNKIEPDGGGFVNTLLKWQEGETDKLQRLVDTLHRLSLLQNVHVDKLQGGTFNVNVKVRENGAETPLSDVGFGVSQMLPVLLADVQLGEESTLYAAQPEIHVHPSVQAEYGSYIVDQVNQSQKRYIVETHSEYLLNRIRLEIVRKKIASSDVKVYYMGEQDGAVKVFPITFTVDGQIHGAPEDFFETYMMDVMDIAMEAGE